MPGRGVIWGLRYTKETIDTASLEDMNQYYIVEEQARYGVVSIEIKLKSTTTEKQMIVDTHIHLSHYLYNNEFWSVFHPPCNAFLLLIIAVIAATVFNNRYTIYNR